MGRAEALAAVAVAQGKKRTPRLDWATLLKRSFDFEVYLCPRCGGRRRVLAVLDVRGVKEVLRQLGLAAEGLPLALARGPPEEAWLH